MQNRNFHIGAFSGIQKTAALSIVALIGVVGFQTWMFFAQKDATLQVVAAGAQAHSGIPSNNADADLAASAAASDPYDPSQLSENITATMAADYAYLQSQGTYSASSAAAVAAGLAQNIHATVAYPTYAASQIPTDSDISSARAMRYRTDLQASLKPLMNNTQSELDIFNQYETTNDPQYLEDLTQAADNYQLAAAQTAKVVVPQDAVAYQIGILDAMQEFAAVLDEMSNHGADSLTETVLLQNYNQAQQDMVGSFNALYGYLRSKTS